MESCKKSNLFEAKAEMENELQKFCVTFQNLNHEVKEEILKQLDIKDAKTLRLVSKQWRQDVDELRVKHVAGLTDWSSQALQALVSFGAFNFDELVVSEMVDLQEDNSLLTFNPKRMNFKSDHRIPSCISLRNIRLLLELNNLIEELIFDYSIQLDLFLAIYQPINLPNVVLFELFAGKNFTWDGNGAMFLSLAYLDMPSVKNIRLHIGPCHDRSDSILQDIYSFVAKHWKFLKMLDIFFHRNKLQLAVSPFNHREFSMKISGLNLDVLKLFVDNWVGATQDEFGLLLLASQKNLKELQVKFNVDSFQNSARGVADCIENNAGTLRQLYLLKFELEEEVTLPPEEDQFVKLMLDPVRNCVNLATLEVYGIPQIGSTPTLIMNKLPESLLVLKISSLFNRLFF